MLKAKLFKGFAILIIMFGVLSGFFAIRMIENRIIGEAQRRVQFDMNSALYVYHSKMEEIGTILQLAANKQAILEAAEKQDWTSQDIRKRLEIIRSKLKLDFLSVISIDSQVVLRTASSKISDYKSSTDPFFADVLSGKPVSSMKVFSREELSNENQDLADQAFIQLEESPRARLSNKKVEDRGMVMLGAAPIIKHNQVLGAIYGGILLNRNYNFVDSIKAAIYTKKTIINEEGNINNSTETDEDTSVGTATIFLYDVRIATTISMGYGKRALGTRVSKEVADCVLEGNGSWLGRAFVVNDWYLTAYHPISDYQGKIIGMLYVGLLEKPFQSIGNVILTRYIWILLAGLIMALVFSFWFSDRLARPIHRLEQATNQMRQGLNPGQIPVDKTTKETQNLIVAFNEMALSLAERETHLKEANEKLEEINESLKVTNRSYMETLGFVSHELKTPVATMMNYIFLLKEKKLGDLTEKQDKAVKNLDNNIKHVVEMIRHYLNLSRIENGVLQPNKTKVALKQEILNAILENFDADFISHKIKLENMLTEEISLNCDLNMIREVFENLISNAIKYGRDEGRLRITAKVNQDFIDFSVANEGEGIPPEKIGSIFQKFSRLEEQKAARKQKGTGLGLFITKHIVEAHGGTISVNSTPNEWTEFCFSLPCYKEKI